jgi:hypothetical protein
MRRSLKAFALLVLVVSFSSCTCKRDKNKFGISLFGIKDEAAPRIDLKMERFENDFFASNVDSIPQAIQKLNKKYGEFFNLYNFKIVQLGDYKTPEYAEEMKRFLTDYYMNQNYQAVQKMYPQIDDLKEQLTLAFSRYHQSFPTLKIPRIYTCISGWNQSVVTSDTLIGIALDKYLGRKCAFYKKLQYENYQCYTLQKDYIVSDCVRAWGYTAFEFNDSVCNSAMCNILYEGKILYFVKQMLPDANDTIVFGFNPKQLEWCAKNESHVWLYLIEHKLLFSTEYLNIRKLVYPAPFTAFFSKESPGRTAAWIGYRIISKYMNENSDVSLTDLMKNTDYQGLLRKSKYKPK